jgi:hypothetical protein
VNEKLECANCSSKNITTHTDTLLYFKDTKLCCLDMICHDCEEKPTAYLEVKMIVKSKYKI